uniref:Uncharacterized protein n=1 Tax=Octopus bimaculoides TaxID=37653 RepID=A0A0L8GI25_OCTBM
MLLFFTRWTCSFFLLLFFLGGPILFRNTFRWLLFINISDIFISLFTEHVENTNKEYFEKVFVFWGFFFSSLYMCISASLIFPFFH